MAYIGKEPGSGLRGRFIYTATAGQTSFTGSDSLGRTLTYTDGEYTDVFLNGVKLDKTDYTATSGTSIVLDSGASADDTLEILAFDTFGLFSGEFAQDVTVAGDLTVSGTTTTAATTMTGDLSLADKIVHTGDTNTAIRFADADTVTVETGGSERLRVTDAGKVGIGETAPLSLLHVKTAESSGTADSGADELVLENSGDTGMTILSGSSNTGSIRFGDSDDSDNGIIIYSHGSSPFMRFFTNGGERLRILSGGGLTFNGDTASANALDDYEEGTWTPTYIGSTTNPSVTYDIQLGKYVKVGGLVHAAFVLRSDAVSGGSGSLFVSGLPFAGATLTNAFYSGSVGYSGFFTTLNPQALHIGSNGTTIVLIARSDSDDANSSLRLAVGTSNLTNAANSNFLVAQMTYPTDA